MATVETHSRRRIGLLLVNAGSFAVWQISQMTALRGVSFLSLVTAVAVVLWLVSLCLVFVGRPKEVRVRDQLEDELTRHNRLLAFNWGYGVTMACTAVCIVLGSLTDIPAIDLVRAILIAGVVAPLVRFALMEISSAAGE